MKKFINLFVAAFGMLAMAAGFTSCEEDAVEKLTIAGSWKVMKSESFRLTPAAGDMNPVEWDVSEHNFVNTFRLDGSFQYGVLRPAVDGVAGDEYREYLLTGNWSYKNGILTMSFNEFGRVQDYELVKLDDKELVMRMTEKGTEDHDTRVTTTYMSRLTNFIEEEFGTTN